ncbi:unnamed protein product [Adineta steineri]|uniref:Uncharacterized protein n=1 Tax=Adineta steineri TaxID=433720 RepID=A0A819ZFK6_9BILA|nr:unnamed protein product [Adineta steineri]CAF4173569.1 unnamed protein product [Adineta steineri]
MKVLILFMVILTCIFFVNSLPAGTTFLICPNGEGAINCKEVKCCTSDKNTCCLDESILKEAIQIGCGSIYPKGHPLGC